MKIRAKKVEEMDQEFLNFFEKIKHLQDDSSVSMEQLESMWRLIRAFGDKTIFVCEIGSHKGFSTAALAHALVGRFSRLWSVDNEMNVPASDRLKLFQEVGVDDKIYQENRAGLDYLMHMARSAAQYDIIFHDAIHGHEAMPEYLLSWTMVKSGGWLIIHDWEQVAQLKADTKQIIDHCGMYEATDARGRVLAFFRK